MNRNLRLTDMRSYTARSYTRPGTSLACVVAEPCLDSRSLAATLGGISLPASLDKVTEAPRGIRNQEQHLWFGFTKDGKIYGGVPA